MLAPWKCAVCGKKFGSRKQIRNHLEIHNEEGTADWSDETGGTKRDYCKRWNGKMWVKMKTAKDVI